MIYLLSFSLFLSKLSFESGSLSEYLKKEKVEVVEGYISEKTDAQVKFFQELLEENPDIHFVGEIGFNAGHSSEVFLKANPYIEVVSFDIMNHPYVFPGKKFIEANYPGRHQLIRGNSLKSIPKFAKENPERIFDLIFIDGGHHFYLAKGDILNMKKFAIAKTLLVVDDIEIEGVHRAWSACIESGDVEELVRYSQKGKNWVLGRYCMQD